MLEGEQPSRISAIWEAFHEERLELLPAEVAMFGRLMPPGGGVDDMVDEFHGWGVE